MHKTEWIRGILLTTGIILLFFIYLQVINPYTRNTDSEETTSKLEEWEKQEASLTRYKLAEFMCKYDKEVKVLYHVFMADSILTNKEYFILLDIFTKKKYIIPSIYIYLN